MIKKRTPNRDFLEEIGRVVSWTGRVATMLRIHFLQQWFSLSAAAVEAALQKMAGNKPVRGIL